MTRPTDPWDPRNAGPKWLDYVFAILVLACMATFLIGVTKAPAKMDVEISSEGK